MIFYDLSVHPLIFGRMQCFLLLWRVLRQLRKLLVRKLQQVRTVVAQQISNEEIVVLDFAESGRLV